jgi:hypothetical protein
MKRPLVEPLQCPVCEQALRAHEIAESPERVALAMKSPRCARYCAVFDTEWYRTSGTRLHSIVRPVTGATFVKDS